MKKLVIIFSAMLAFTAQAQTDTAVVKKVVYPKGYEEKIDAVYSQIGDWKGREDIYYNPTAARPTPVVFNIHGGGWNHGVKEGQGGFAAFFKMGFAVANIEYRLTGQAKAPAAVEDVRAAILYVVQHAKELNIDPNKIIVMGGSAGGHLALMAGLLQNDNRFDGAYKHVKGYTIAAIIDKYGITDVWDWAYGPNIRSKSATNWLGDKAKDEAFAKSVSPIYYVKKTSPPTFIVHGDADPTVPYQQSVDLKKKYDEVACKSEFMTISGGKHGGFEKDTNTEMTNAIMAFIKSLDAFK
ncbi:MAG: alpha/beta hydrolase [Flavobacterium sp.]|nr:alpha/beta hydrolase [Flavobacterium sp.]